MNKANFISAVDAFAGWREAVLAGEGPVLWPAGSGELARVEIGPGLVVLIGGPPGSGKTAVTVQLVVDALRLTPTLRALVANVEMPPGAILDRQLSRLSGIDGWTVRHRQFTAEHADRLDRGLRTLETVTDRLAFVKPPFTLENVAASVDAFHADLILLDYIQRITPPGVDQQDRRGSVDATMNFLRQFADAGVGIIVVSSVARGKDSKGRSTYSGDALTLASYRESAELEFGADDAYMLTADAKDADQVVLRHLKSRHGETRDLTLRFDRAYQRFEVTHEWNPDGPPSGRLSEAVADLWDRTPPAGDDREGGAPW